MAKLFAGAQDFWERAEGMKTRGYGRGHRNVAEAEGGKDTYDDVTELVWPMGMCGGDEIRRKVHVMM